MKNILTALFITVTMYLPNGNTKVWENVLSWGFEDGRGFITRGYAMIPVLWFVTQEGKKMYIHGNYTVEMDENINNNVILNKKDEEE